MDFSKYNYKNTTILNSENFNQYNMNLVQSTEYFNNMLCCHSLETIQNIYIF